MNLVPVSGEVFLTLSEVMELLGVAQPTVQRLREQGALKVGGWRSYNSYTLESVRGLLAEWLDEAEQRATKLRIALTSLDGRVEDKRKAWREEQRQEAEDLKERRQKAKAMLKERREGGSFAAMSRKYSTSVREVKGFIEWAERLERHPEWEAKWDAELATIAMDDMSARVVNMAYESEQQPAGLVGYVLNRPGANQPPPRQGGMFDYVLAADGLYLHAEREELDVCFQIAQAEVRGLGECRYLFNFKPPYVPANLLEEVLEASLRYAEGSNETLFWLEWSDLNPYDEGWLIREPEQTRKPASCRPDEGQDEAYQRAIIEIHSHHSMPARFSLRDDRDEVGFRLYGVIGNLPEAPEIRLRVGVYGYRWEISASWALDLPGGLTDCNPDLPPEEEPD